MNKKKTKKVKGSKTFEQTFGECPNCGAEGDLLKVYHEFCLQKDSQMVRRLDCMRCHGMFEETYKFVGRRIIVQGIKQ